jgi:hypothetical protein
MSSLVVNICLYYLNYIVIMLNEEKNVLLFRSIA